MIRYDVIILNSYLELVIVFFIGAEGKYLQIYYFTI